MSIVVRGNGCYESLGGNSRALSVGADNDNPCAAAQNDNPDDGKASCIYTSCVALGDTRMP